MPYIQLAHPPQTRDQLWAAVAVLFGVRIPRTQVCPDHVAPFTAFADAYFRTCTLQGFEGPMSRAIWHASRGLAGKSKTLSILGLTFTYIDGADTTILGGSMTQSVNVHEYMVKAMESENLPPEMTLDQTATKIQLTNKGRVRPLPASQRTVRGPHPSVLLMDEVDEMDIEIYDAALGQPMPQEGYLKQTIETMTVLSSTWQYADGTFTEILRRAEEKHQPVYRWCYKENQVENNPVMPNSGRSEGWLTAKTIKEKKDDVSEEMFRVEYDLGEPSIGNRAVDTEKLDLNFLDIPAVWEEHKKDWDEWRFFVRVPGATYCAGADWAKERDKTVISIVRTDRGHRELVYTARINRTNYPRMVGLFNRELMYYQCGLNGVWHDSTGLGNVIDDLTDVRARPFTMTGVKRTKLLSDYVLALEKVTWRIPKLLIKYYTEHKYASVGDLYSSGSSKEFHLPDTFCSLALAEYGAERVANGAAPINVEKDGTPSRDEAFFGHRDQVDELTSLVSPAGSAGTINLSI